VLCGGRVRREVDSEGIGKRMLRRGLTTLGSQLWFIYTKSLFTFMCSPCPICKVAYVGLSTLVQGGKESLAKTAYGGRVIKEMDFVVKSEAWEMRTFWIEGWEGWTQ
jgi:hypothetical protein